MALNETATNQTTAMNQTKATNQTTATNRMALIQLALKQAEPGNMLSGFADTSQNG